jgi:predicted RND superfamily exporter protein
MKRYARLVTRHPIAALVAIALLSLAALHGVVDLRHGRLRLEIDPAIDRLLPDQDEERLFYEHVRGIFGGDQFLLVVLKADDVFTREALDRVAHLTRILENEPGVQRVVSLANATNIESVDGDLAVGPFFEQVPSDPGELARLRDKVLAHPLYRGTLVSEDGGLAAILVYLGRLDGMEERALTERVMSLADSEGGGFEVLVTGVPRVKVEGARIIVRELFRIAPLALAIAAAICFAAFRTGRGVLLPVVAIGLAEVWTLGLMGWTGSTLNLVSNIVPPLIITLGFAAAIHVVAEYYEILRHTPANDRESHRNAVERMLQEMGLAVAVNGFTTALGFASLMVSRVTAIREFGFWSVVGVVAATVAALVFLPAILVLLGPARRLALAPEAGRVDRLAERLARFDVRNRRPILVGALGLLAIALFGMSRIHVSTDYVRNFSTRSPVRQSFEALNERLGGANSFFIVIEGDEDGAFAQPENLRALRELQDWLETQPEVGHTASLADGVMLLNRAFSGDDPAAFAIPDRARLVKQLLLFAGDDATHGFVDRRLRTANVVVRSTIDDSATVASLLQRLNDRLAALPKRLTARPTGDLVLLNRSVDDIARGQLESIATALLTIYLTLAALLTSFRIGLIALLPNLLPIAIYYGTLGLLGIPLNIATSLIGEIALGIAVDDTVHYFTRFNLEARRLGDEEQATVSTLRSVIRPVTFTTLGLCLGFLVLATSELRNQVQFGLLSAFTLAVAWALEMTLSPALCAGIRLVTLWDLVALDLGEDPQRQIPLFGGLSARQSRIFALMSNLVRVPAGQRLFTEGERGEDMYVVIDGELTASLQREGERVELARMRRGEVVGEVALFSHKRSADVDVLEDARLLRFGHADLERLGRRYPRIASHVYRNLSDVLAQRVVSTQRALR